MGATLELPFGVVIDMSYWEWLFGLPVSQRIQIIMAMIGWAILAMVFVFMAIELWVAYRQFKYTSKWKWVLLAVDIPPLVVQTHKAVEQIFAQLSGAQAGINVGQKYWMGKKQKWFSLEIISLEGYIQFLIRTESEFRDLVEAAIYAQYPEAEITEVEDYTKDIPSAYPNTTHDIFGVEFKLDQADAYPIRTYPDFEYNMAKDVTHADPIASILENFTRISAGENLWLQLIIEPTSNKWKEKGIELVKKIVANKKAAPKWSVFDLITGPLFAIGHDLLRLWEWNFEPLEGAAALEPPPGKVSDLTPGMKETVQAIEDKISKIGFKSKMRFIYVARKENYNPGRCVDGLVGALSQFHSQNRNSIVACGATLTHYAFADMRLNWLKLKYMSAFKKRKLKTGANPYMFNIEELATIWHFPLPFVKTPLLQHTTAKRAEPPLNLPIEMLGGPLKKMGASAGDLGVPANLPFGDEVIDDSNNTDLPYA